MVFRPARTFNKPGQSQSGQPAIGAGAQTTGPYTAQPPLSPWQPVHPTKGRRSWTHPFGPRGLFQRGQPSPGNAAQRRPTAGSYAMNNVPPIFGGRIPVETPYFSRGTAAIVNNYGKVLYDPIGAGVVAMHRPQASYGVPGQFIDSQIFWANQVIPTSVNLQGLTDPEALAEVLGEFNVYAAVRVAP